MRTLLTAEDRRSIRERLGRLTPNDAHRWGKMKAGEMVCHLYDSFGLALSETEPSMLVMGPMRRSVAKWLALKSPTKRPKGIRTRPEMEQGVGGTKPCSFEEDRGHLLEVFDYFCENPPTADCAHPIFGVLTREEWMRWGWLHADHHLRQFGR